MLQIVYDYRQKHMPNVESQNDTQFSDLTRRTVGCFIQLINLLILSIPICFDFFNGVFSMCINCISINCAISCTVNYSYQLNYAFT